MPASFATLLTSATRAMFPFGDSAERFGELQHRFARAQIGSAQSLLEKSDTAGYFADAGSGTTALFFGCGFINRVSAAPAMSRMPAVMKEDFPWIKIYFLTMPSGRTTFP
jgi:hypothetical protein